MKTYFLDTETTGLSAKTEHIVELAIVDDCGEPIFNTLVNPGKLIPPEATAVHGIRNKDVQQAPTLQSLWPSIQQALSGHRVVAYNVGYDRNFFPDRLQCAAEVACAMHRFARYTKDHLAPEKPYKTQSLDKASVFIGHIWSGTAHRALADTLACKAVWDWLEKHAINGINIFSGAPGLGGALTNMTELAREKGMIKKRYPVRFKGVTYLDAEAAYQGRKLEVSPTTDPEWITAQNDQILTEIIQAKFIQHPKLMEAVTTRGGVAFLRSCSHDTGAKTPRKQAWEGQGEASRFIRCLIQGYTRAAVTPVQPELLEA